MLDSVLYKATTAACKELDKMFPGFENGGVTSQIAGNIEKAISAELETRGYITLDPVTEKMVPVPKSVRG